LKNANCKLHCAGIPHVALFILHFSFSNSHFSLFIFQFSFFTSHFSIAARYEGVTTSTSRREDGIGSPLRLPVSAPLRRMIQGLNMGGMVVELSGEWSIWLRCWEIEK
jgi:hypothetical protein